MGGFDEDNLKAKYKPLWDKKTTQEKIQLGYAVSDPSIAPAKPSKRKLKENPFDFPSTATLNSHLKQFLKVNHLLDSDTAQSAPPKKTVTQKRKPKPSTKTK